MAPAPSAGLLLWRRAAGAGGGIEVFIAHMGGPFWSRKDARAWSIPKGEFEPGETALAVARREFTEEIGAAVPAGEPDELGTFRYTSGKTVTVFALEAPDFHVDEVRSSTFDLEWPPRSGRTQAFPEVDRAEWVSLDTAREKVVSGQVAALDALASRSL
jgi:predicted NUDIX family NTP pyrophosphohydrolase